MYARLRDRILELIRAPLDPPDPPAGSHRSVQVFRASPRYLRYRLLRFALGFAAASAAEIALITAAVAKGEESLVAASLLGVVPLAIGGFLGYFAVRIDYDMRVYVVTDRSLRVRQGAWVLQEMTISYANVQNLRLVQGPLLRLFGIWNLRVDAAGGGGRRGDDSGLSDHAIQMAGIENAAEVRDLVLGHLRTRALDSGLGDPDDVGSASVAGGEMIDELARVRDAARALRAACEVC